MVAMRLARKITTIFMARRVFVDTSAFVALANAGDQYHQAAVSCMHMLQGSKALLITSNFILDETYTRLRRRGGIKIAVAFGDNVRTSRQLKVLTIDRSADERAWAIFTKYADHDFSYTDCTSFALMRAKKITEAFAFDADFRVMGFTVLPQ